MNKRIVSIVMLLAVYLITTSIAYGIFSTSEQTSGETSVIPEGEQVDGENDYMALTFDPNKPKTEECPLTGVKYSKEQREWWESHRPLGVMIENHADSRPQSGLSFADTVYEAVAEGGITRTLSVFYCQDAGIIGPVRSARTYFLDFISEYGDYPLYAHVGGANTPGPANALGQIEDYGWAVYNDLNQFSIGYPTFWRDQNRLGHDAATEHTMYSTTSKLWEVAKKRGLTNVDEDGEQWDASFVKYGFKDDEPTGDSQKIQIEFWDNETYYVDWIYDAKANIYNRENGGEEHVDRNTKKQISAKNVIVLFMTERNADDGYENNAHLLYGTTGQGNALVFLDGKQIKGKWKKAERTDRLILLDGSGEEVEFNRGNFWFEVVSTDSVVKVL
jgi:hypothetical protein